MKAIGSNVTAIQGGVAKLTDLDHLYEAVKTKGRIDVVFANAGVAEFAPMGKITEEHFDRLFDINVKGTLFTVQKALPLMNDGGSIILKGRHYIGDIRRTKEQLGSAERPAHYLAIPPRSKAKTLYAATFAAIAKRRG